MLINASLQLTRKTLLCLSLSILLLSQGCTHVGPPYHPPLPKQLENQAQVPGFTHIRAWADTLSPSLEKSMTDSIAQEKAANHGKLASEIVGLALSGGGEDGAFGAGLLCGWTQSGTRPTFKLVSGISTGSLIAPFAFLGPSYDAALKEAYTTISSRNIYKIHNPIALLLAAFNIKPLPSLANDAGLAQVIEKYVDEKMLKEIAIEHLKGRRLIIGTTQLYAQRLVIWNMGAIAASGSPNALKLFQKILLASASVPVTFPPQYFKVEAAHKFFDEMHVDGGVESEVFLLESAIKPFAKEAQRPRKLYIIRNQKVNPEWQNVKSNLKYIASRAIQSLTKSQGVSDLYRLYVYTQRDQIDYNLAVIPPDFTMNPHSPYDKTYMNNLFVRGFSMGKAGYPWSKYPPDFIP